MCVKHGATKERKRCSVKGCATFALKGGVCRKHGAKIEYKPHGVKDVQILLSMEDCALGMEQRSRYAELKGAQINPNEEECARDTVHTAIALMNLLLSHRV